MADALEKAIQTYSAALQRRLKSREKLHHAEQEDKKAATELSQAKEDLRNLEMEISESIIMPGRTFSAATLEKA